MNTARNLKLSYPLSDEPRVALICPPEMQGSQTVACLKRQVADLSLAKSLVEALLLIRDKEITHFLVMVRRGDALSERWVTSIAGVRDQTMRDFEIIRVTDGEECGLLTSMVDALLAATV